VRLCFLDLRILPLFPAQLTHRICDLGLQVHRRLTLSFLFLKLRLLSPEDQLPIAMLVVLACLEEVLSKTGQVPQRLDDHVDETIVLTASVVQTCERHVVS